MNESVTGFENRSQGTRGYQALKVRVPGDEETTHGYKVPAMLSVPAGVKRLH